MSSDLKLFGGNGALTDLSSIEFVYAIHSKQGHCGKGSLLMEFYYKGDVIEAEMSPGMAILVISKAKTFTIRSAKDSPLNESVFVNGKPLNAGTTYDCLREQCLDEEGREWYKENMEIMAIMTGDEHHAFRDMDRVSGMCNPVVVYLTITIVVVVVAVAVVVVVIVVLMRRRKGKSTMQASLKAEAAV